LEAGSIANLRADVWRLAAHSARSERDLIQALLDIVGPALQVVQAGFHLREADSFVCTATWSVGQQPSWLGISVPENAVARWIGDPGPTELSRDSARIMLLEAQLDVSDLLKPELEPQAGFASFLFIPFVLAEVPEGFLSLTKRADLEADVGWSVVEKRVLSEVVQIITLVVERLRAEDALRASETRYRSLVENLGEGVGIMNPSEVFLYANPAGEEIFGVPAGALQGRSLHDFTDERSFRKATEQTGLRKQGKRSSYELEIRRPDGTTRVIVVIAVPEFDHDGNLIATIGNFRDVTAQRQAELQRQQMETRVHQAQKLESLGLLAGGIAHDFNNLLLGVLANADMALDESSPGTLLRECLDDILNAARKASELTGQMLAYAGRGRVQVQSLDLGLVVQDMGLLLRASISKKAIMVFNLTADLPSVEGDVTQIRQVVMNLITNASDALGDSTGRIVMSTSLVEIHQSDLADPLLIGAPKPGEYVCFEVSDTGCGMDDTTRVRIFDPFFTTRFTGRGLGLAAVLGILRVHQGAIRVSSTPGEGTVFRVLFPSSGTRAATRRSSSIAPNDAWKGKGTILVIDDEDVVRRATTRILERAGLKVIAARDGPEGLKKFDVHAEEIAVVVLDLAMPQMSGEEVFCELHARRPDLPVILISGYDEQEAVLRFTGKGISGFVRKPFDAEGLLDPIRKVLC
jgi:PAS domain S-box-containing protein